MLQREAAGRRLVEILVPGEDDDDEMEIGKNEEQHDDVGESLWPRFQS